MESLAVTVKGEVNFMEVKTNRIHLHQELCLALQPVICRCSIKQSVSIIGRLRVVETLHLSRVDSWGRKRMQHYPEINLPMDIKQHKTPYWLQYAIRMMFAGR